MKFRKSFMSYLFVGLLSLSVLTGCGGGGDDTPSPSPTTTPSPSPTETPTPSPSPTTTPSPSPIETPTPSPSPTATLTPSSIATPVASSTGITSGKIIQPAVLISVSSASAEKLGAEWLPAEGTSIEYEVHVSKSKDFTPDNSTLKSTTRKESVTINKLDKNTKYYVAIVTKSLNVLRKSNELSVMTSNIEAQLKDNITIKNTKALNLSENNLTTDTALKKDDFVFSTEEDSYLRKVTSSQLNADGTTFTTTETVHLRDVYKNIEFSSSTKLIDIDKTAKQAKSSSYKSSINLYKTSALQGIQTVKRQWSSGLTMSSYQAINSLSNQKVNSSLSYKIKKDGDKVEQKEDYFSGSISSDKIAVDVGDTLNEKIEIINLNKTVNYEFDGTSEDSATEIAKNKLFCEQNGGTFWDDNDVRINDDSECHNIPVKICKIEASITDISIPGAVGQHNQPRIEILNNIPYLKWSPLKSNIDYDKGEPYEIDLDIDITPGIFCGTKDEDTLRGDTIDLNNIQIQAGDTLLDKSVTLSEAEKTIKFDNGDISISNVITADFSPTIDFYGKISGTSLKKAHASVKSKLKLGDKFVIKANGNGKHIFNPKPIYTKKFTKIIPAGAVPIVVVGRLRLMAVAEIDSEGSIETTVDIESVLNMDIEVNYNPTTNSWDVIKAKSFTYKINAGGKGNTKVTGTIRIIPSLELSLYETVASHFVLEPYVYSTIGIEGEINLNISKDIDTTLDKDIQFSALEAGIGLDAKVYVGPAWDSSDDIGLAWPDKAVFAASKLPLKDASFMNSKHISKVKEYYDATNTYNVYNLIEKKKVLGIPDLTYSINTSELPPKDINSRAIKIVAECTPIDNILYPLGKKNYIECDSWEHENISNNFTILKDNKDEKQQNYWLIPNVNHNSYDTNKLRLVNNSSLNWARQYITVEYHSFVDKDKIPNYWKVRYGITDEGSDDDGDKYSNLLEYINGTSPKNDKDYPVTVNPDISNPLLDAPTNIKGTFSKNEVSLTWNGVSNAIEYQICMAEETIVDPTKCDSYIGGKLIDVSNTSHIIKNLIKDKTYYFQVKGVASGYEGVWSSEINVFAKESNLPENAIEINLCANQTAYLENKYTLGMQLNTQTITGNVFEKSEDFTGAAFCGEFASATSSQDVLDSLKNAFSDAKNVITKTNSDGSIKVQYEMIGENIQAYSLLKTILEQAGVSDFSNYVDYTAHTEIKDVYIDLFIKYVNSSTVYVILAVTDKNVDNTDDLNTLVADTSIAETQTVKQTNTDTFTYTTNSLKTDILFVMDDSGSMSGEQNSASQAIIDTFGTAMSSKGIDWKATVIGTGVGSSYSSKYINTPVVNDITTLASQLRIGTNGLINEEGLKHAYLRLKNGDISIRNDSKLSIVYISDEIEHTSLRELDVDNIKDSYFVKNNIKVNVIIPETGDYEYSSGARDKDLAYDMANATNGEVANLRNYATGYKAMMQKIADDSAGSASQITLSKEPTVATIIVTVNGTRVDSSKWNYNSSNKSIVFIASATPKVGDKIEVSYNY